jgi:SRSO17 transposase
VGVARQYCGELGKRAKCQALVSLTLARAEVPVGVALRLFLPERWAADQARRAKAGVPEAIPGRPKWRIALDELDRVRAAGATFGCVLADAEYGKAAEFRAGLAARQVSFAKAALPPAVEGALGHDAARRVAGAQEEHVVDVVRPWMPHACSGSGSFAIRTRSPQISG